MWRFGYLAARCAVCLCAIDIAGAVRSVRARGGMRSASSFIVMPGETTGSERASYDVAMIVQRLWIAEGAAARQSRPAPQPSPQDVPAAAGGQVTLFAAYGVPPSSLTHTAGCVCHAAHGRPASWRREGIQVVCGARRDRRSGSGRGRGERHRRWRSRARGHGGRGRAGGMGGQLCVRWTGACWFGAGGAGDASRAWHVRRLVLFVCLLRWPQ